MENKIFHIDLDAFFASVELLEKPYLENEILVVGKKVVSTANYYSRQFGIKSGMLLSEAKSIAAKNNKRFFLVHPNLNKYKEVSLKIEHHLSSFDFLVIRNSIDEWFINLENSAFLKFKEFEFASFLKNEIYKISKLNCSIGNSFTYFLSKLATEFKKPNGYYSLNKQTYLAKLKNLPVIKIHGIGKKTNEILEQFGIVNVADLLINKQRLINSKKFSISLEKTIASIEGSELGLETKNKSLSKSLTMYHITNNQFFIDLLVQLASDLQEQLDQYHYAYRSINLKLSSKWINKNFNYTHSHNSYLSTIDVNKLTSHLNGLLSKIDLIKISKLSISLIHVIKKEFVLDELIDNKQLNESLINKLKIKKQVNKKLNQNLISFLSEKKE